MNKPSELGDILKKCLGNGNVYFQPPESVSIKFPCIIFGLSSIDSKYADNRPYLHSRKYTVTVVDSDPNSEVPFRILELPACSFERFFISDNLNHFVFSIYF